MSASGPQAGYVTEIYYTDEFFPELCPLLFQFVSVLKGSRALDPARPYTMMELGCGNALSTTLLAAANPQSRFYAVDFNASHIASACRRADAGGVENITFIHDRFANLAAMELPCFDIVVLHGVYCWVNAQDRLHIVRFLRQQLKPGGAVYVSYNCLPGWAQEAPLQRLLLEASKTASGTFNERIDQSTALAGRLQAGGAAYFRSNPTAPRILDMLRHQPRGYVAHEYFDEDWTLFYHDAFCKEMAEANLCYSGSATVIDNFDQLVLTPELQQIVAQAGSQADVETLRDYATNRRFRRDIFLREAEQLQSSERSVLLDGVRFALVCPRFETKLSINLPAGPIQLEERVFGPVLDALADQPLTAAQFCELPTAPAGLRAATCSASRLRADRARLRPAHPATRGPGDEAKSDRQVQYRRAEQRRGKEAHCGAGVAGSGRRHCHVAAGAMVPPGPSSWRRTRQLCDGEGFAAICRKWRAIGDICEDRRARDVAPGADLRYPSPADLEAAWCRPRVPVVGRERRNSRNMMPGPRHVRSASAAWARLSQPRSLVAHERGVSATRAHPAPGCDNPRSRGAEDSNLTGALTGGASTSGPAKGEGCHW